MFNEALAYKSPYTQVPEHLPNVSNDLTTTRARVTETQLQQTTSKVPASINEFKEYVNGTGVTIWIRTRNGVVMELQPDPLAQCRGLMIRYGYRVSGQTRLNPGEITPERKIVGTANFDVREFQSAILNNQLHRDQHYNITEYEVYRDYLITTEELHIEMVPGRQIGRVHMECATYVANLDVVVANHSNIPAHPGQESLQYVGITERVVSKTEPGVVNHISIVDNDQEFGDRFIQWQGRTQRVKAQPDSGRADGVYVSRLTIDASGKPDSTQSTEYFSFDEAEQLDWLYRSKRDAQRLGGAVEQERRALELAKERTENERKQWLALNSDKVKRKEEVELEIKIQRAEQEMQLLRLKSEAAAREQQYALDRMAYERHVEIHKQQTEMIKLRNDANKAKAESNKWLLPLISLFTGLLTILKKSK